MNNDNQRVIQLLEALNDSFQSELAGIREELAGMNRRLDRIEKLEKRH
jgi:hypothetical protein